MNIPDLLRTLPSVDRLLHLPAVSALAGTHGRERVTAAIRSLIADERQRILHEGSGAIAEDRWPAMIAERLEREARPALRRVVNCSGVIAHTNLGRALLAPEAARAAMEAGAANVNLEYDLTLGERGDRDALVEALLERVTGAPAATVVNNNAAAVLLALNSLAEGRAVIVSRGELIEIGGSFRLPEIMAKSGCALREVGTTNRTHLVDYERAINERTGLILRAHTSNYRVIGFTAAPEPRELAALARARGLPLAVDLGSGTLIDLRPFGLPREPTVQETLAEGADVVTFSGDKLLGGPQAGVIVGSAPWLAKIKKNHLRRALRTDKMTLAALEATLRLYENPEAAIRAIPTLRHLTRPVGEIREVAQRAAAILREAMPEADITLLDDVARAGAGSLPEVDIPSVSVAIKSPALSPGGLAAWFRGLQTPIIGRVENDLFRLDMRCVDDPESVRPRT